MKILAMRYVIIANLIIYSFVERRRILDLFWYLAGFSYLRAAFDTSVWWGKL